MLRSWRSEVAPVIHGAAPKVLLGPQLHQWRKGTLVFEKKKTTMQRHLNNMLTPVDTMSWRRVEANLADSARAKFERCGESLVRHIV